jgi:signal transduction histidine kinase
MTSDRIIPTAATTVVGVIRSEPSRTDRSRALLREYLGPDRSRPWRLGPGDVALMAACLLLMFGEVALTEHAAASGWGALALIVASLPVLIRRWTPVVAFLLAFAGLFVVIEAPDSPYDTMPAPVVVCAYAVAVRFGRRTALVTLAATLPFTLWILQTFSPHALFSWGTAQNLSLVVLPLALGLASHDRQVATTALVERAEAAERSRDEEALRRVGEERLRIARDVHDVVAHAMVTINVQAGVGAYLLRNDPDQAHAALRTIKQLSGDALTDLRQVLGLLRADDNLTSSGWTPSERPTEVAAPVGRLSELDGLRESLLAAGVVLDLDVDPAARTLPAATDATLYRIAQEALTNTLRHVGPTRAHIQIALDQTRVLVTIEDDGPTGTTTAPDPTGKPLSINSFPDNPGLDNAVRGTGSGNGLRGMRERAVAVGGALEAGPRPEGGWRVAAWLPIDRRPAQAS